MTRLLLKQSKGSGINDGDDRISYDESPIEQN